MSLGISLPCMKKDSQIYLKDIQEAVSRIEIYTKGINQIKFSSDLMMQDAVIRQLEIIGEAAGKLDEEFLKNNPGFPAREASAMRNILIHEYNYVNIEQVWKTVREDLPRLKEALGAIV